MVFYGKTVALMPLMYEETQEWSSIEELMQALEDAGMFEDGLSYEALVWVDEYIDAVKKNLKVRARKARKKAREEAEAMLEAEKALAQQEVNALFDVEAVSSKQPSKKDKLEDELDTIIRMHELGMNKDVIRSTIRCFLQRCAKRCGFKGLVEEISMTYLLKKLFKHAGIKISNNYYSQLNNAVHDYANFDIEDAIEMCKLCLEAALKH